MITYQAGDLSQRMLDGGKYVVAIVCNDVGVWEGDFTHTFDTYPDVKRSCQGLIRSGYVLGHVGWVVLPGSCVYVASMIAKRSVNGDLDTDRLDYRALRQCLTKVREVVRGLDGFTVLLPRVDTVLDGPRDWERIEGTVENTVARDNPVIVFALRG